MIDFLKAIFFAGVASLSFSMYQFIDTLEISDRLYIEVVSKYDPSVLEFESEKIMAEKARITAIAERIEYRLMLVRNWVIASSIILWSSLLAWLWILVSRSYSNKES